MKLFSPLSVADLARRVKLAAFVLPGLLCASGALAEDLATQAYARGVNADNLDTWNILVGSNIIHDSNLFRLPSSADTRSLVGSTNRSDTIFANAVGLKVNKAYSLQRFELDLNLIDYRYQNFDNLNYTARNHAAAWRWSLTPYLTGNLTSSRKESLNNFADFRNFGTKSIRTDDDRRFDADLDIGGGWHLLGGMFEAVRKNSQLFVQESDNTIVSSEAGARYAFTSGSTLTFLNRIGHGTYNNRPQALADVQLDNKFTQTENELSLKWPVTGKTSVDGRIAWIDRKHANFSSRDFSGYVGAFNVNWNVTEKSLIKGGIARDIYGYQDQFSSYSVTERIFVSPVWQMTEKTALRFRYDLAKRDFLGAIVASPLDNRTDRIHTGLIALDWKPEKLLAVSATVQNDRRTSNQSAFEYKDTIVGISALLTF